MPSIFFVLIIIMMFAAGGVPPPTAKAQSFTIYTRLTNSSDLRRKLTSTSRVRPLRLDQGIVFPPMPSGLVYVTAHFGTPPLTINLALDTLFPFTWVQTVGCRRHCFNVSYPFTNFDPRKSTSFALLPPNNTIICSPPVAHPSRSGSLCVYNAGYSDGIFGIDEFQLLSHSAYSRPSSLVVFGCDLQSRVDFNGGWDFNPIGGMLGLGKGHPSSIVSQLGSERYSYCLPGFAQWQSGQPSLTFGADAVLDAATAKNIQTTPLITSTISSPPEMFYNYLNMTAVTMNGHIVYVMPENTSANLVLLDTGSPDSWLVEDAVFSLQDAVIRYFAETYGWKKVEDSSSRYTYPCCYELPSSLESVIFPRVALQFLGGASLELHNAFEIFAGQHEFCMVIREGAPNTIGVYQQLGYRFLFDQAKSQLSFAPNMC